MIHIIFKASFRNFHEILHHNPILCFKLGYSKPIILYSILNTNIMKVKNSQKLPYDRYPLMINTMILVIIPNWVNNVNLTSMYKEATNNEKKKNVASNSFAAPIQTPNTNECLLNLGTHILHIGQCKVRNDLGILHSRHFIWGFYK